MKQLLIVNNHLQEGGISKALLNFLEEMKGRYEITLFLFARTGAYAEAVPEGVHVMTAGSWYRYLGYSQAELTGADYYLRGLLVFLTHIFGFGFAVWCMNFTQKTIVGFDIAVSFHQANANRVFYGGCNEFVIHKVRAAKKIAVLHCDYKKSQIHCRHNRKVYASFDRIAADSEGSLKSFREMVPMLACKSGVLINCNDFDRIRQAAQENPVVYEKAFVNIVTVARLSQEKGIDRAIRAVAVCTQRGAKLRYYIVGGGREETALRSLITELGMQEHIFLLGNQKNPYRHMVNADLFLLTSRHESAGLVLEEAKVLGLPILTTDFASAQEMVVREACGWVCAQDDAVIADALYHAVTNREELEKVANRNVARQYSNRAAVQQFQVLCR